MDKNYLIAGGSSGIGKACARQLVSSEANVVLVSGNEEKLCRASVIFTTFCLTLRQPT